MVYGELLNTLAAGLQVSAASATIHLTVFMERRQEANQRKGRMDACAVTRPSLLGERRYMVVDRVKVGR